MSAAGYELLDSGGSRRLERIGDVRVVRTAPQATWRPLLAEGEWASADATHHRHATGGGRWEFHRPLSESWPVEFGSRTFEVHLTDFGHIGFFPEQLSNWEFLDARLARLGRPARVLNLFAYSGGSTLTALAAGAEVVHVDASTGVVEWARANARLSGLDDRPVRWLVDDVPAFVRREIRRERAYDAVILDPPSFGRGKKGEVFKIEEHLNGLLGDLGSLLAPEPVLVLFSCHSPGITPRVAENILADSFERLFENAESGEMTIPHAARPARPFPTGVYVRLWNDVP